MMPTSKTGPTKYLPFTNNHLPITGLGFTLLELTVVLAIIGLVSLMIIPSLGGFYTGLKFRETIRRLISSINYARSQAVTTKKIYRLNISQSGYFLSHQEDPIELPDTYTLTTTPLGKEISLPDGIAFKQPTPFYITFHPTGRVEATPIYLEDKTDKTRKITINPLGRITIEE